MTRNTRPWRLTAIAVVVPALPALAAGIAACRPPLSVTTEEAPQEAPQEAGAAEEAAPGGSDEGPASDSAEEERPDSARDQQPDGADQSASDGTSEEAQEDPAEEPAEWAIAVYMSADNELEPQALEDLNEMEAAALGGTAVSVVVLLDRANGHTTADGDWTGTRLYEVTPDPMGMSATVVSKRLASPRLGITAAGTEERNTGAAETLSAFLDYVREAYPARRTALVLWGLGSGYEAVSVDDGNGSDLLLTGEVSDALEAHDLDVIGLDLAFGAQLEIAYEFRSHAATLVASQQAVSADGWEYGRLLSSLATNPESESAFETAALTTFRSARADTPGATISVVDLTGADAVFAALDELSTALIEQAATASARNELRRFLFEEVEDFYRTPGDLSLDLGDLATRVGAAYPAVSEEAATLEAAVDEAVQNNWAAEGANEAASGLSVHYVPVDGAGYAYPPHDSAYFAGRIGEHRLSFVTNSVWVPNDSAETGLLYRLWYESM